MENYGVDKINVLKIGEIENNLLFVHNENLFFYSSWPKEIKILNLIQSRATFFSELYDI